MKWNESPGATVMAGGRGDAWDHDRSGDGRPGPGAARPAATALRDRDPSDPLWRAVELAQRGRMILDVTAADLEAAEAAYGPFHPTAWHFRNAWYEARRSWDRLRAELGGARLDAALAEPPLTVLALGPGADDYVPDRSGRWPLPPPAPSGRDTGPGPGPGLATAPVLLLLIGGRTYRALRVAGTPLAPLLWRLSRLNPPLDDGPYYACRLHDRSTQCDCAEWTYQIAGSDRPDLCKHLAALDTLGWI
jgi:hypothetical protein